MSETIHADPHRVTQLRLVVAVDDFDAALRFYHDVLGLPIEEAYDGDHDERVVILGAGRATLELASRKPVSAVLATGSVMPNPVVRAVTEKLLMPLVLRLNRI